MNINRLMWAEALLAEGAVLPLDVAVSIMNDGVNLVAIEDRIDGFVLTDDLLDQLENHEYH